MIEYMRQEPPDVQEYYQCEICQEEKHINELRPPNFVEKRIICDDCNGKICEHCGFYPIILNGCRIAGESKVGAQNLLSISQGCPSLIVI